MEPGETRVVDDMEVLEYPLDHPNQVKDYRSRPVFQTGY